MKILVINAGSSSLKFQLIDMDDESVKAKGLVERIGIEGTHFKQTVLGTDKVIEFTRNMKDHTEAISAVLSALTDKDNGAIASLDEIGACGHRVLHGGETFKNSVLVTEETMKGIEELVPLGPLHQPANIAGIKACQAVMPTKPNVAVFDTAFHQTMPKKAFLYGVPYEYYTNLKVRRYGFHGTSHRFIAGETPKFLGKKPEDCKFIICHLGNGSSLSAIVGGKVVDTSMGLTPLEGVLMGTRSGDVDPAVLEYIMDNTGMDIHQMLNCLNKKSGFAGLSCSSDMRDVKVAAEKGRAGRLDVPYPEVHRRIQCGGGRRGRDRLHGGHRRERLRGLRARDQRPELHGREDRPGEEQARHGRHHQHGRFYDQGAAHPDQRGAADRARHAGDRLQAVSGKIC